MIFQPTVPSSELQLFRAYTIQAAQIAGGTPSITPPTHTHTHSHRDTEDLLIHLRFTSLGCGRKLESAEKTHADMRRTCPLHTEGGPGQKSAFFFLIHIITKQRWTKHHYSRAYCTLVSSHCPCPWAPGPCCHVAVLTKCRSWDPGTAAGWSRQEPQIKPPENESFPRKASGQTT